jgi:F-type H+-transporting ATPase subunit a
MTVFFFVLGMNLLGMVPGSTTATANINVTAGMATVTLSVILVGGMREQGALAFWKNLIPHGVPAGLKPLLFLIEVIGIFAKVFALTVRLFANMTAGHIVLFVLIAFIIVFKNMFYVVIPASVVGAVAISCLEVFVAFLQAYIFTFLSTVFIGAALHPEH